MREGRDFEQFSQSFGDDQKQELDNEQLAKKQKKRSLFDKARGLGFRTLASLQLASGVAGAMSPESYPQAQERRVQDQETEKTAREILKKIGVWIDDLMEQGLLEGKERKMSGSKEWWLFSKGIDIEYQDVDPSTKRFNPEQDKLQVSFLDESADYNIYVNDRVTGKNVGGRAMWVSRNQHPDSSFQLLTWQQLQEEGLFVAHGDSAYFKHLKLKEIQELIDAGRLPAVEQVREAYRAYKEKKGKEEEEQRERMQKDEVIKKVELIVEQLMAQGKLKVEDTVNVGRVQYGGADYLIVLDRWTLIISKTVDGERVEICKVNMSRLSRTFEDHSNGEYLNILNALNAQ